jgi:hypothetical protein
VLLGIATTTLLLASGPARADLRTWIDGTPIKLPEGYEIDVGRDPPRYASPVSPGKLGALRLWPEPVAGAAVTIRFQNEGLPAMGGRGGARLGIRFEWEF